MKIFFLFLINVLFSVFSFAQNNIKGRVFAKEEGALFNPLPGVLVYCIETNKSTKTDFSGSFEMPYSKYKNTFVLSYKGYVSDTVTASKDTEMSYFLNTEQALEEVVVIGARKSSSVSLFAPMNSFTMNEKELLKAACCNLSESFETNPSVGVSYSDALTGVKQIKLLGLTSPYILITQENSPSIRGASQTYGLSFIPGTWIESIQVTKGMGSVVNGFESISGQINTELRKPKGKDAFFINIYGSASGRAELNTHFLKRISDNWSTGLFFHLNQRNIKIDRNNDGFLDAPIGGQLNIMNRWQYSNYETGWVGFVDLKHLSDLKQIGSTEFIPNLHKLSPSFYGGEIDSERTEVSAKLGYVFKEKPFQSLGFQSSYSNHKQDSYFGIKTYDIEQNSFYFNSIFQSILSNTMHKFKTGISFTHDDYTEYVNTDLYLRNENSVGGFFEYTFDNIDDITLVSGVRIDYHSAMGLFVTPRLNFRYQPWEAGVFKMALGRGQRIASVFSENQKIFASSREIKIKKSENGVYGLNPEVAWNYGISYLHKMQLFGKSGSIALDYFITDFESQVLVDYDQSSREINFYNLEGESTAKSFQIEFNYDVFEKWELRTAYQLNDVLIDYQKGKMQKPLQPRNTFFMNLSYESTKLESKQWKWDITFNWLSKQRIPDTSDNPFRYQLENESESYSIINSQLTYVLSSKLEFYSGIENLLNITQKQPIIASDDPFGDYFDTTLLYAPVLGAMYYGGIRYKI